MDELKLTASQMTNRDALRILDHFEWSMSRKVYINGGMKIAAYVNMMRWLDRIGVSKTTKGKRRKMLVSVETAREMVKKAKWDHCAYMSDRKRQQAGEAPMLKSDRTWVMIQPGPGSVFRKGSSFSTLEIRIELQSDDPVKVFADGTRFKNSRTGDIAFWYHGQLWKEGEDPRPILSSSLSEKGSTVQAEIVID